MEAETFGARNGTVQAEPCVEGGQNLGSIADGNWTKYGAVGFGTGISSVHLRAATRRRHPAARPRSATPDRPAPAALVRPVSTRRWWSHIRSQLHKGPSTLKTFLLNS
ncbi:hypothetical protein [Streptomyces sp. NPDC047974]|uniref:hypothetical protein n=1 Tax=Streptomyces sp. NPDC047974 TaxID=3154343 RepID=UPI0033C3151E